MFLVHFADYLVRRNLQHLIVHVTNRCNYRCKHCFIDFSRPQDLSLEECVSLAGQVGNLFWLDIGGGEPFLRKDLPDIVCAFKTRVVTIPTNGSLRDAAVEQLKAMRKRTDADITVCISIDGLQETHDSIRKQGSWDEAWATYDSIRGLDGISLKINTVLSAENHREILDLMEIVKERAADFHSVMLLRGSPSDPALGLPSFDDLEKLIPRILKILAGYHYGRDPLSARVLRNYHRYLWKLSVDTLKQRTQVIPCLAGRAHMVVMPDGSVHPCELLPAVGNIKDSSWREILEGEELKKQVKSIKAKDCHCTHNCAMLDSILFNPANIRHLVLPTRME